MLTRLTVRNFKTLKDSTIELGNNAVFIGPNNSGKTTALQALTLWAIGIRQWLDKRSGNLSPEKRSGVVINRRDLVSIPVPTANMLWHNLRLRNSNLATKDDNANSKTQNVRVEIIVDGISADKEWSCGLEFDFANEESLYCRPLRIGDSDERMIIPETAVDSIKVAFLPPMSGLSDREFVKQAEEIEFLIGQGQTAQVLRNLCFILYQKHETQPQWQEMTRHVKALFGIELLPPVLVKNNGIIMEYKDKSGNRLDISSSGRGLQQTVLLLAYLYSNPGTVLMLDEPDAHLEILRQRQIYNLLSDVARQQDSQLIVASHSEVILGEAVDKGSVIAFCGKPHRINDRGSQLKKSLDSIGWDQYYQAEQTGWVLYLEGASDLEILRAFAQTLKHEKATEVLARPFVHYLGTNHPPESRKHFNGLKEARADLVGIAIFDRLDKSVQSDGSLVETMWKRREIENYFCIPEALLGYARHGLKENDLSDSAEAKRRVAAMEESIVEITTALKTLGRKDPWSHDTKVSDDFLDPLFRKYYEKLELFSLMRTKADFHTLVMQMPLEHIDPEITEKLDAIVAVAAKARPCEE